MRLSAMMKSGMRRLRPVRGWVKSVGEERMMEVRECGVERRPYR